MPVIICLFLGTAAPVYAQEPATDKARQVMATADLSTAPGAQELPPLENRKSTGRESSRGGTEWGWRRASVTDYAGSAVALAGTLYSESVYGNPKSTGWSAHNGFDESIRGALRLKSASGRDAADTASDVLMGVMIAAPVLDSFAILGVREGRWDAAWQTEMINLESLTFTGLACSVMGTTVKRARPFVRNCPNGTCSDEEAPNRSMPSGHEAFAFTGAGLLCTNHAYQSADPEGQRAACALSLGLATTTGILRIMADRHYATDVAAGTLIGLFSGFVLPRLLHYSWLDPAGQEPGTPRQGEAGLVKQVIVAPQVLSGGAGVKCDLKF